MHKTIKGFRMSQNFKFNGWPTLEWLNQRLFKIIKANIQVPENDFKNVLKQNVNFTKSPLFLR